MSWRRTFWGHFANEGKEIKQRFLTGTESGTMQTTTHKSINESTKFFSSLQSFAMINCDFLSIFKMTLRVCKSDSIGRALWYVQGKPYFVELLSLSLTNKDHQVESYWFQWGWKSFQKKIATCCNKPFLASVKTTYTCGVFHMVEDTSWAT